MGERGRKARISNPYPSTMVAPSEVYRPDGTAESLTPEARESLEAAWREDAESLAPTALLPAERALFKDFTANAEGLSAQAGETVDQAARRIAALVEQTLERNAGDLWWTALRTERFVGDISDARDTPSVRRRARTSPDHPAESPVRVRLPREPVGSPRAWPGRQRWKWAELHVGTTPPKRPLDRCLWLDTSGTPKLIRTYRKASKSWDAGMAFHSRSNRSEDFALLYSLSRPMGWHLERHWQMVKIRGPLDKSMRQMLTVPTKTLPGHDGRPAFLARAVLAALLGTAPEKITNFVNNHQFPRRRRKKTRAIARVFERPQAEMAALKAARESRKRRK